MPTTPLGIEYHVDADDWQEQYVRDANQIVCNLRVNWRDVADFKREMLGYTERDDNGGSPRLRRTLPILCPLTEHMRAMSMKLVNYGSDKSVRRTDPDAPEIGPNDLSMAHYFDEPDLAEDPETAGWWRTDVAIYQTVFARPPWRDTVSDDDADADSEKELSRYVYISDVSNARELRRPDFGFESDDGDAVPIPYVGFMPDIEKEIVVTWYEIPADAVPRTAIDGLLLKLNASPFYYGTYADKTLLFKAARGMEKTYTKPGSTDLFVDVQYQFGFRKDTWNKMRKPDGTVANVRRRNQPGTTPYTTGDFATLFVPE